MSDRSLMTDFERVRAVKRDAQAHLRRIPGVHAVGIGAKTVGGQRTSEPAIIVFMSKKKPLAEISPDQVVPAEIEGIKTDVIEAGKPRNLQLPDRHSYRDSGLDGGIQIQIAEDIFGGTLGCIARTDEPDPKIIAITNHHVVSPASAVPSQSTLTVNSSANNLTFSFGGISTPELQVVLDFVIIPTGGGAASTRRITYITEAADSPASVATGLAILIELHPELQATTQVSGAQLTLLPASGFTVAASPTINRIFGDIDPEHGAVTIRGVPDPALLLDILVLIKDNPQAIHAFWLTSTTDTLAGIAQGIADGINAPRVGPPVPVTATVSGAVVTIAPVLDTVIDVIVANTFPAHAPQPSASLKASIAGHTITFTGSVSGGYYGVFTNVNTGAFDPSYGIFVAPKKNMDLNDLASSIAAGLTNLKIPNATIAAPGGAQITITGAEEIECLITSDVRVGQPDNSFPSSCLDCMNNRIGTVKAARLDLDCALIQLDPGMKYKNEIEQIGIVSGTHTVTHDEATSHTYHVQKRGCVTGWTCGTIWALDVDGEMETGPNLFHRRYAGAMQIHSVGATFSNEGDSGAAVLNSANEVIGILFGGSGGDTVAIPIGSIQDAMEVIVQSTTADQKGKVFTVPQPAALHAMSSAAPSKAVNMSSIASISFQAQLRKAEQQLDETPLGRPFVMFVRHFSSELQSLINTNRRVAAIWRRNGGPTLVQVFLAMLQKSNQRIPVEIYGRPLSDCIMNIQRVLARYGSPGFAAVLSEFAPRLARMAGHAYRELIIAGEGQHTY